jgi:hypothetical protein
MKYAYLIFIVVTLLGCNNPKKEACLVALEKSLTPVPNKAIIQGEILNFRDSLGCFEWDALVVESGYGSKESIKKTYGVEIPYCYNNSNLDGEAIIFFLKEKIAVNHIKVDRQCNKVNLSCKSYDFTTLMQYNANGVIAKKDAVFEVYTREIVDNQGNKYTQKNALRLK